MSAAAHAAPDHDHQAHLEAEHTKFHHFVNLALFMAAITGIELVVIFLPFATWVILFFVVGLSVVKFIGVILWFMHLIYDHKLLTIAFVCSLLIATGTVIALLFLIDPADALPIPGASLPVESRLA